MINWMALRNVVPFFIVETKIVNLRLIWRILYTHTEKQAFTLIIAHD